MEEESALLRELREHMLLQAEYRSLQQQYEEMKDAKIDQEVRALLERHNKYVAEVEESAETLVKACQEKMATMQEALDEALRSNVVAGLRAELAAAQDELAGAQLESLERERELVRLRARNAFLERFARVPETADRCVQTDSAAGHSAGCQAPTLVPSLVPMLEARALAPEGAEGQSVVYRGGKAAPVDAAESLHCAGLDASYTVGPAAPVAVEMNERHPAEASGHQETAHARSPQDVQRGSGGSGSGSHRPDDAPEQAPAFVVPAATAHAPIAEAFQPADDAAFALHVAPQSAARARRSSAVTAESRPLVRAAPTPQKLVLAEGDQSPVILRNPPVNRRLSVPVFAALPRPRASLGGGADPAPGSP